MQKILFTTILLVGITCVQNRLKAQNNVVLDTAINFNDPFSGGTNDRFFTIDGNLASTVTAGVYNAISANNSMIEIQKRDLQGNVTWTKTIDNAIFTNVYACMDILGAVYVHGTFYDGTIDLDPGSGTVNATANFSRDVFILKLNAQGDYVWSNVYQGSSGIEARSIDTDDAGNVFITGIFEGTADFDPTAAVNNYTSNGGLDIYIHKVDPNGVPVFTRSIGGTGDDYGQNIKVDLLNDIYITGAFSDTVNFAPFMIGVNSERISSGALDGMILKLSGNGLFSYVKSMGGSLNDVINDIDYDDFGNLYVVGYFEDTAHFEDFELGKSLVSKGNTDGYLLKFNEINDSLHWINQLRLNVADRWISVDANAIGQVYVCGFYVSAYTNVDLDPSTDSTILEPYNSYNGIVASYTASGQYVWGYQNGSNSTISIAQDVYSDPNHNSYTVGWFSNSLDFDPGVDTFALAADTVVGTQEGYLQKTYFCGTGDTLERVVCDQYVSPSGQIYTSSGIYQDSIMTADACGNDYYKYTIALNVDPINMAVTDNSPTLMANQTSPTTTYQWINCSTGMIIPGETGQSFTATANDDYAVIVDNGGCSDTSVCISVVNIGIDEYDKHGMRIYPNPGQGIYHLEFNSPDESYELTLIDLNGRTIRSLGISSHEMIIDLTELSGGIYNIRAVSSTKIINYPIIKH